MTSSPAAAATEPMTPMLKQYFELKEKCGNAILFFRMGDFYELFGKDAEEIAPVLELILTSRERGDQQRIPFCGVPHHSVRNYLIRLLRKGYKIAIAEQIEDPALAKGLVRREITRILTPGCIDELEGLDQDAPNYVLAVHEDPETKRWCAALADLSTGELRLGAIDGLAAIRALAEKHRPKEILGRQFFHKDLETLLGAYRHDNHLLIEPLPEAPMRDRAEQKTLLSEVFGKSDIASQPCGPVAGGDALVAGVLAHFRSLQASLQQFLGIRPLAESNVMPLSETVIRDLELFETVRRRQTEGSLFREINFTVSPMGARLLRYNLANPLVDAAQIRGRHAAVRCLVKLGGDRLAEVRQTLKGMPDLERLGTRIFAGVATPVELARARQSLACAAWITEHLTGDKGEHLQAELFKVVATGLRFHRNPLKMMTDALVETPQPLGAGDGVFVPGFDRELDRLMGLARNGEQRIEAYQEELKAKTGIGSLKIRNHKSLGLLIEITKSNLTKVPPEFIRRQTMVNCERYTTLELQDLSDELTSASSEAVAREAAVYAELLGQLGRFRMDIRSVAHALATLDMLVSFAECAVRLDWCEPKVADDERVELTGSRHPVVERYVGRHAFTANDIVLTGKARHLLITGPNMAGKSTVMRQTALAAILNQIGSFVPARAARLPVFDRIYTRVGAADDLSRGQSTFMVEMAETAEILRHATARSLVILDEVGRGTSTQDGLAIASAILQDLAARVRSYTLFATHYHELVPFGRNLPAVKDMQTEVIEQNDRVVFTHRLIEGACDSSYGIEVARIAGVPDHVLQAARHNLTFQAQGAENASGTGKRRQGASVAPKPLEEAVKPGTAANSTPIERLLGLAPGNGTVNDRARATEVLDRLTKANLNRTTPLQALNLLAEMQSRLAAPTQPGLFAEET